MAKVATKSNKKKVAAKVIERTPAQEMRNDLSREFPKLSILDFNYIHETCFSFRTITYQGAARVEKYLLSLGLPAYREDNRVFVSKIKL